MHTWKIMDPSGLQMDQTQARDAFLGGQGVFTSNVGNVLPRANNKAYSKRAGDIQLTRFPALQDVGKGPMGWARMYGLSSKAKQKDASWRLISFMGGKDKSGAYYTAKDWYLKFGVGYSYQSMDHDPDIIAVQKAAGYDLEVRSQQYATAQMRDNISSPWYSRMGSLHAGADPERASAADQASSGAGGFRRQGPRPEEAGLIERCTSWSIAAPACRWSVCMAFASPRRTGDPPWIGLPRSAVPLSHRIFPASAAPRISPGHTRWKATPTLSLA